MNRQVWETQFSELLQQKLQLTPQQVRFGWSVCYFQGQTPTQALAFLERTNELYPHLRILPGLNIPSSNSFYKIM
jgi:hypothetical protein